MTCEGGVCPLEDLGAEGGGNIETSRRGVGLWGFQVLYLSSTLSFHIPLEG